MASDAGEGSATTLAPDDAFAVLGNEMRMEILQTLGAAQTPLSFSELQSRVEISDSGQFNYHLDKLVGHFVRKTADGYELRRAGERVVEAVLSGAVTEAPVLEPTRIDQSCQFCGAPIGVKYGEERVTLFCTECAGIYGNDVGPENHGHLGSLFLPPSGIQGRTATEILQAAYTWGGLATMAAASGICPRCSAPVERSVDVCSDHQTTDTVCETCGGRYRANVVYRCTNCIYERGGAFGVELLTNTDLLAFLTEHGTNPVVPSSQSDIGVTTDYDEEILSADPFEGRFTFTVGDDALTLTVGGDLSVVDVTRHGASGSG